jgi:hypothetical protein
MENVGVGTFLLAWAFDEPNKMKDGSAAACNPILNGFGPLNCTASAAASRAMPGFVCNAGYALIRATNENEADTCVVSGVVATQCMAWPGSEPGMYEKTVQENGLAVAQLLSNSFIHKMYVETGRNGKKACLRQLIQTTA